MKMLVANDGSQAALAALRYAIDLASGLQSPSRSITLINVHEDAGLRRARTYVGGDAVDGYLADLGKEELAEATALLDASGIEHHAEIRTGHVAQQIVDCAKEGAFDLVVLGAKGRSAIADLLIGSVAQRVLATATTPVLIFK